MQEIQHYETILINAFSVDAPEARWTIFFDMVQQLCTEIQEQGRSLFYERCLSCYHNGMTPGNQKLSPGWFSRNALNIVFAVNYLLRGQAPQFLKTVMAARLGPLNNILRDNPALQDIRYTRLFREAQNYYDARLRCVLATAGSAPADKADTSGKQNAESPAESGGKPEKILKKDLSAPVQPSQAAEGNTPAWEKDDTDAKHHASPSPAPAKAEQDSSAEESVSVQEKPPATQDRGQPAEETSAKDPEPAAMCSIPTLLLPLLAENQAALNDAIRAQKQLDGEIANALSAMRNPFSHGAAFQRQLLSSLGSLVAHQEECNHILLSNLSRIESALGAAQWEGFVEIAALLDEFSERHSDPDHRRPNAMWGDIRAIRQRYTNQLHRQGIEPIVPVPGDAFDEDLHELADDTDIDIDDAARITKLYTRGYRMEDAVFLRAIVDADDGTPDR